MDEVDGRVVMVPVAAPARRLAVNGDGLLLRTLGFEPICSLKKQPLELAELYSIENTVYRVVRWYPNGSLSRFINMLQWNFPSSSMAS